MEQLVSKKFHLYHLSAGSHFQKDILYFIHLLPLCGTTYPRMMSSAPPSSTSNQAVVYWYQVHHMYFIRLVSFTFPFPSILSLSFLFCLSIILMLNTSFSRLTTGKNKTVDSLHVPTIKFIGMEQLVSKKFHLYHLSAGSHFQKDILYFIHLLPLCGTTYPRMMSSAPPSSTSNQAVVYWYQVHHMYFIRLVSFTFPFPSILSLSFLFCLFIILMLNTSLSRLTTGENEKVDSLHVPTINL